MCGMKELGISYIWFVIVTDFLFIYMYNVVQIVAEWVIWVLVSKGIGSRVYWMAWVGLK